MYAPLYVEYRIPPNDLFNQKYQNNKGHTDYYTLSYWLHSASHGTHVAVVDHWISGNYLFFLDTKGALHPKKLDSVYKIERTG